jgi:hypothetical protein
MVCVFLVGFACNFIPGPGILDMLNPPGRGRLSSGGGGIDGANDPTNIEDIDLDEQGNTNNGNDGDSDSNNAGSEDDPNDINDDDLISESGSMVGESGNIDGTNSGNGNSNIELTEDIEKSKNIDSSDGRGGNYADLYISSVNYSDDKL